MEYRSRSVRLDDEVWAAIQKHELSANKLLRVALGLDRPRITEFPDIDMTDYQRRGSKASTETRSRITRGTQGALARPLREKGDVKR